MLTSCLTGFEFYNAVSILRVQCWSGFCISAQWSSYASNDSNSNEEDDDDENDDNNIYRIVIRWWRKRRRNRILVVLVVMVTVTGIGDQIYNDMSKCVQLCNTFFTNIGEKTSKLFFNPFVFPRTPTYPSLTRTPYSILLPQKKASSKVDRGFRYSSLDA